MTYEIVKKLKDAGFPQEGGGKIIENPVAPYPPNSVGNGKIWMDEYNKYMDGLCYFPTLSELVEVCDKLVEECLYLCGHKDSWTAVDGRDGFGFNGGEGSTPEEAVANLWFTLNENK